MDGLTIQQRIYAGRGKAALRIGLDCRQYRPLTAAAPLGNPLATLKAAFNSGDSNYLKPNLQGDAIWFADLDGRITQPGDYLVRVLDGAVWYIAGQQQLLPIVCVDCNRTLRLMRPQVSSGSVGLQAYGSATPCDPTSMTTLAGGTGAGTMWPASILFGGKSQQPGSGLPGTVKQAGWRILLPPSLPVVLQAGDMATDDLGRRYSIEGAELTEMGWRLDAKEVHS